MRIIKKYSNRRLYDTTASRYVNLDELAALVRANEEVRVVDVKTGDDLTRPVLLQVLLEVQGGADMLPMGLLHRIIRLSGDGPMSRMVAQQLSVGLELLDAQMSRMERQFGWLRPDVPPPEDRGAAQAAPPDDDAPSPDDVPPTAHESGPTPYDASRPAADPSAAADAATAELDALRARLAGLEGRLRDR